MGTCGSWSKPSRPRWISQTLGEQGHWVRDLRPDERSLEDLFLELTTDLAESQHDRSRAAEKHGREPSLEEVGR